MTQPQEIAVRLPVLNDESLVRVRKVTHAYRSGGARTEHQVIENKHIFHNYGLGASAAHIAPGVSYISAKSYTMYFDVTVEDRPCAVIGAGVVGVSTALELIKRGRKVTVYSAAIPDMDPKEGMEIPSQQLPTVWMPKEYDYSQDMLKHQLTAKYSYDSIRESVELSRYQSIRELSVYDAVNDADDLKDVVNNYICNGMVKAAKLRYENGTTEEGATYKTYHINSRLYLQELKIEAMLRGVKFVQRKFNSLQEILHLKEDAIWNCTNQASAYLFGDENYTQQHHYLLFDFEKEAKNKEEYVYRGKTKEDEFEVQCVAGARSLIIRVPCLQLSKEEINRKLLEVKRAIQEKRLSAKL